VTLYIQKDSPGKDKEANWLPAPNDLIYVVMRLYRYEAVGGNLLIAMVVTEMFWPDRTG
jgi:hypothetical protein